MIYRKNIIQGSRCKFSKFLVYCLEGYKKCIDTSDLTNRRWSTYTQVIKFTKRIKNRSRKKSKKEKNKNIRFVAPQKIYSIICGRFALNLRSTCSYSIFRVCILHEYVILTDPITWAKLHFTWTPRGFNSNILYNRIQNFIKIRNLIEISRIRNYETRECTWR